MFSKSKKSKPFTINEQEISTLIGLGYEIKGDIDGKTTIRVDGKVIGNVSTEQGLILGEKGSITGNVSTKSAIIYGKVTGDVRSTQLEIKHTGVVNGNIKTETLEIEMGAQYNGNLEMKQLIRSEDKANEGTK
jgi:cytoskeletal protein CcmA (bactofilin family)